MFSRKADVTIAVHMLLRKIDDEDAL